VRARLRGVILTEAGGQFWAKICATEKEQLLMDADHK
jgi:hypothetical protein